VVEEPEVPVDWGSLGDFLKKPKKKKKQAEECFVIKQEPVSQAMEEELKMKIGQLEFQTHTLDKLNKGMRNSRNNCFMNVILQCLLSSPPFFNMLQKLDQEQVVFPDDSLAGRFVELCRYHQSNYQLDKDSIYAKKVVPVDDVFAQILYTFNPDDEHQDCGEYLQLILDMLHNELKTHYKADEGTGGEWNEVGKKKMKMNFKNKLYEAVEPSVIFEIFGGILRNEFNVDRTRQVNVRYEPFFIVNLELNRSETLEDCLFSFCNPKNVQDYKLNGRTVRAQNMHVFETLPNVLVLHLKRFIFRDRAIKLKEEIEYPKVLKIHDDFVANEHRLGVDGVNKRAYRLFGVIQHKGTEAGRGHYVCYTLDGDDKWIFFDDEKVRQVPEDTVLDTQAYVLFYELIN